MTRDTTPCSACPLMQISQRRRSTHHCSVFILASFKDSITQIFILQIELAYNVTCSAYEILSRVELCSRLSVEILN